tara:strand:+ start:1417 stop:1536 length:120 start_codon:yes stop_codon:yes gene_type:complete
MIWPLNKIVTWWKLKKIREADPFIYEDDDDDAMFDEDKD